MHSRRVRRARRDSPTCAAAEPVVGPFSGFDAVPACGLRYETVYRGTALGKPRWKPVTAQETLRALDPSSTVSRMLRIYLDTFVWVHLAKAAHSRPDGGEYADALEMCRAAKAHGIASFPIDLYRYWETSKNRNEGSRNRLADTIIELSDFDTISLPFGILDDEIDQALRARFGRPHSITPRRVFGRGIRHLTNGAVSNAMRLAHERPPSDDKSSDLRVPIDRQLEEKLLRAGPADHTRNGGTARLLRPAVRPT